MAKANRLLELIPIVRVFVYPNNLVQCLVKTRTNVLERHYFKLTDDNDVIKLEIFPIKDKENYAKNPVIVGKDKIFDDFTDKIVYYWEEGSEIAYPLGYSPDQKTQQIGTQHDLALIQIGERYSKLVNPYDEIKKNEEKIIMMVIIGLLLNAATLFVVYSISEALEIELF